MNPKEILDNPDDGRRDVLASHNLEKLIKELGQQGNFKFHQFKTVHKEQVSSENYHQVFRYCISVDMKEQEKTEIIEETLKGIAEWISEGM